MKEVIVVIGSGSIGQAIARRISAGSMSSLQTCTKKTPMLQPDRVTDPLNAYQISKRGNALRVMAEAVRWGKRGARINTISPGIIITPLAKDELSGPRSEGYRRMLALSPAGRAGTPDAVGHVGALLMGPDGTSITSSDFLMDGGVIAAYWCGELAPS